MATVTGTTSTFSAVGEREDLTDVIWDISPTDTPFQSSIARVQATGVTHEWQTDALAAAATNRQIEGDDVAFTTQAATTRLNNKCQISRKQVIVSGTLRSVDTAGRDDELAYQIAKVGREIRRDIELTLTQNQASSAGSATAARSSAGLESWIATNKVDGTSGATTPGFASGDTVAPTDNTAVTALTRANVDTVIQAVWSSGGNPTTLMVGPFNKRAVSTNFTGITAINSQVQVNNPDAAVIIGGVDLYRSDFGDLTVVPNRFQRDRTAFILDLDYFALAMLRGIEREPLAKTGDADKEMLITEYCLESRNEASSGKVADLSSS